MLLLAFDRDFVRLWSDRYVAGMPGTEQELLGEVGPRFAARGHMTPAELCQVGHWKSSRAAGYLARNEPVLVADVTRVAFAADTPDRLRHRVLCILDGVGQPMASAILTIWNPAQHTILDRRAVEAFRELRRREAPGLSPLAGGRGSLPDYWAYLQVFLPVARRLGVSCRDLDRALWKWNQARMPEDPGPS
jgi:hypothetical protein